MPPPSTTLPSLMQTPRTPGDLGASRRRALKGGVMEGDCKGTTLTHLRRLRLSAPTSPPLHSDISDLSDIGVRPPASLLVTPSHSPSPLVLTSSFSIFPWTLYIANPLVRSSPVYSCGNSLTRYVL